MCSSTLTGLNIRYGELIAVVTISADYRVIKKGGIIELAHFFRQFLYPRPMSNLITILNGPNLNLLGIREPELYGADTLSKVSTRCEQVAGELGLRTVLKQTNHEGEMIDWIQAARDDSAGVIINPAAWSHTSVAILDALNTFEGPVIEVHISNIHAREPFRHHSYVSNRANGVIAGCGVQGYAFAVQRLATLLS